MTLVGTYDMTNARTERTVGQKDGTLQFRALRTGGRVPPLPCRAERGFQDRLPLLTPPDLLSRADYMFETSLGLIGVLKNHLERSLALAPAAGKDTINADHLEASALAPRARLEIAREIERGEAFFNETADAEATTRKILGLESTADPPPPAMPTRPKRRVGERNPHRDPVGVEMEVA